MRDGTPHAAEALGASRNQRNASTAWAKQLRARWPVRVPRRARSSANSPDTNACAIRTSTYGRDPLMRYTLSRLQGDRRRSTSSRSSRSSRVAEAERHLTRSTELNCPAWSRWLGGRRQADWLSRSRERSTRVPRRRAPAACLAGRRKKDEEAAVEGPRRSGRHHPSPRVVGGARPTGRRCLRGGHRLHRFLLAVAVLSGAGCASAPTPPAPSAPQPVTASPAATPSPAIAQQVIVLPGAKSSGGRRGQGSASLRRRAVHR